MPTDSQFPDYDQNGHRIVPAETENMPPGIPYIVSNEAAERFSFYGMKAILAIFITDYLLNADGQAASISDETAKQWVHYFTAAVYFFPIIGAILADWFVGKYRMIMTLSIVYVLGHAVLAFMDFSHLVQVAPKFFLFIGLTLIAVGSGGIKPCVSAHVGDQFGQKNHYLVSRVFGWFYFAINFGSTFATLFIPVLLKNYGPGVAFGVPGVLMAIATFLFWLGRNTYVHIPAAGNRFIEETFSPRGLKVIFNLIPLYLFVAMFWALFDQTASAWVLQSKEMNLHIGIGDYQLLPSQLQAMNPILVMVLIPIFSYLIYPALDKVFKMTPLRKVGIGLFLTVPAFALPAIVQGMIEAGQTPGILWHFWAYVLITAAEVMVSITVLEFSYTQAPPKMKSFIMGMYLLSVFLGNIFTAQVNHAIGVAKEAGKPIMIGNVSILEGANYFWFFTVLMFITAIIFVIWSPFYRGRVFVQGQELDDDIEQDIH